MRLFSLTICLLLILLTHSLNAATYYVSTSGNDTNTGKHKSQAWANISRINSTRFSPGDTVLFEGNKIFKGSIILGEDTKGTATKPIVFGSYGPATATINSGDNVGISVYNTAGIKFMNLKIKSNGRNSNKTNGVEFITIEPSNMRLEYIALDMVEVSGYAYKGIYIGSWNGAKGFNDISITNSLVHDNGEDGIVTYAETPLGHHNMYIGHNKVYNNTGIKGLKIHTGNGILIGDVDGVTIEYCEVYNNGELSDARDTGPAGVWAYKCNDVLIQYNEAHHNKTGGTKDGGGFDIDGGCTNSIMQYNYSHDNDGAGFLISQYRGAPPMENVIIRYNISENDGRKNSYAGILFWSSGSGGGIQNVEIYNNTVYLTPSKGWPAAIRLFGNLYGNVRVRNNIFQTTPGTVMTVNNTATRADIIFQGNSYWNEGAELDIEWGQHKHYSSLEEWRSETDQETLEGKPTGYETDALLVDPGKGVTISDPTKLNTLRNYELQENSPVIEKGLDLASLFGIDVGTADFFGNSLKNQKFTSIGVFQQSEIIPLPVTLRLFQVSIADTDAVLYWETASEYNNKGFEVEVATDGENFRTLDFIASKSSNSQQAQQYTYRDTETGKKGTRYYRLRQIDIDGTATYSAIETVTFELEQESQVVYPNPFSDRFTIAWHTKEAGTLKLYITDALGRKVLDKEVTLQQGKNELEVELGKEFSSGVYFISTQFKDNVTQLKMIKQ